MKLLSLMMALTVGLSALAGEEFPPSIEASAVYRTTVAAAKSIVVFEGLPHQSWDKQLFAVEIERKDTRKIWEYPFYTPSVPATNSDDLRELLSRPDSIAVYGGAKACGGYHPLLHLLAGRRCHLPRAGMLRLRGDRFLRRQDTSDLRSG